MEIPYKTPIKSCIALWFKIDLIVWKLNSVKYMLHGVLKFKIDLIVWKL